MITTTSPLGTHSNKNCVSLSFVVKLSKYTFCVEGKGHRSPFMNLNRTVSFLKHEKTSWTEREIRGAHGARSVKEREYKHVLKFTEEMHKERKSKLMIMLPILSKTAVISYVI